MSEQEKINLNKLKEAIEQARKEYLEIFPEYLFTIKEVYLYANDTQASITFFIEFFPKTIIEKVERYSGYHVFDFYIHPRTFPTSEKPYNKVVLEVSNRN